MKPRRSLVVLGAVVALVAVSGVVGAERVYFDDGYLSVPLADGDTAPEEAQLDPHDCEAFDRCPEDLRGDSFDDHHVGPPIDASEPTYDYAYYRLRPTGDLPTFQAWQLCGFDDNGTTLFCDSYVHGWSSHLGTMPLETEHVRVTLRPFVPSGYTFGVYT